MILRALMIAAVSLTLTIGADAQTKGTNGGIVVTANDVTERVRTAEALRDSERRIRIVTDNVPVLIAYVDRDQRFRLIDHDVTTAPQPDLRLERFVDFFRDVELLE